jgi:hypothetical protein
MNTRIVRCIGAGLLGATIIGVVGAGVASAAPAATTSATKASTVMADYTRGFDIVNMTTKTLDLVSIDGPGARDGYAPPGTKIAPGQTYHYEKVFYFGKTLSTNLVFNWADQKGKHIEIGAIDAKLTVDAFGFTQMNVDHGGLFDADVQGNSGRAIIMEKDFSTVTVPDTDAQKQADLLEKTCTSGLASCTFTPSSRVAGTPLVKVVAGGNNNTATARPVTFGTKAVAGTSQSVELSASAKIAIGDVFELGMAKKYGTSWTSSKEEFQQHNLTIAPYTYLQMSSRIPTEKVTGDFTVILGKTTWKLTGVSFTIPAENMGFLYDSYERPLTPQERATLPEDVVVTPVK